MKYIHISWYCNKIMWIIRVNKKYE